MLVARRVFSVAMVVYLIIWVVVFAFVYRVFGSGFAIALSVILALPIAIALRMFRRWHFLRRREFVFLFALLIVVFGTISGLIWNWYDTGMDRRHVKEMEFVEFGHRLQKDPAFRNIELLVSPKEFWMRGTVASSSDLNRLKSLAAQGHISWDMEEVKVVGGGRSQNMTLPPNADAHGSEVPSPSSNAGPRN